MMDIQYIDTKYCKIVAESKKLYKSAFEYEQMFEFKERLLGKYFNESYGLYFSKRIFEPYKHLSILETIENILGEIKKKYGSLEEYKKIRIIKHFNDWHVIRRHKGSKRILLLTIRYNYTTDVFLETFTYLYKITNTSELKKYFIIEEYNESLKIKFFDEKVTEEFVNIMESYLKKYLYKDLTEEL